jgi:hypothetical protein
MGLKPGAFQLWVKGESMCTAPPCMPSSFSVHCVAVQVAFESKVLKPGSHSIGSRLKPGAFKALWVNWIREVVLPHHFAASAATAAASAAPALDSAHFIAARRSGTSLEFESKL